MGGRASACERCFSPLLNPIPPVPTDARWAIVGDGVLLQTDLPLQNGPLDCASWTAKHNGTIWEGDGVCEVTGGTAVVGMRDTLVPAAGESVSYDASTADLVGTNGAPVAAFVDFPLT